MVTSCFLCTVGNVLFPFGTHGFIFFVRVFYMPQKRRRMTAGAPLLESHGSSIFYRHSEAHIYYSNHTLFLRAAWVSICLLDLLYSCRFVPVRSVSFPKTTTICFRVWHDMNNTRTGCWSFLGTTTCPPSPWHLETSASASAASTTKWNGKRQQHQGLQASSLSKPTCSFFSFGAKVFFERISAPFFVCLCGGPLFLSRSERTCDVLRKTSCVLFCL